MGRTIWRFLCSFQRWGKRIGSPCSQSGILLFFVSSSKISPQHRMVGMFLGSLLVGCSGAWRVVRLLRGYWQWGWRGAVYIAASSGWITRTRVIGCHFLMWMQSIGQTARQSFPAIRIQDMGGHFVADIGTLKKPCLTSPNVSWLRRFNSFPYKHWSYLWTSTIANNVARYQSALGRNFLLGKVWQESSSILSRIKEVRELLMDWLIPMNVLSHSRTVW